MTAACPKCGSNYRFLASAEIAAPAGSGEAVADLCVGPPGSEGTGYIGFQLRDATKRMSPGDYVLYAGAAPAEIGGGYEIIIPRGCDCPAGSEIGDHANTVELPTPAHMLSVGRIGCYQFRETTCVDRCVAPLVQALWDRGVITTGACCGHNVRDGYIGIADFSGAAPAVDAELRSVLYAQLSNLCEIQEDRNERIPRTRVMDAVVAIRKAMDAAARRLSGAKDGA